MTAIDLAPHASVAPAQTLHVFSSESVSEGHPDKVCDFIADSILDAHLAQDPDARVACEVLCKDDRVILAGEISSRATVDHAAVAREAIRAIGYTDPAEPFNADGVHDHGAPRAAVARDRAGRGHRRRGRPGAHVRLRDERDGRAHAAADPARARARGAARCRPQGRARLVAAPGREDAALGRLRRRRPPAARSARCSSARSTRRAQRRTRSATIWRATVVPDVLGAWYHDDVELLVNPTGSFVLGGPSADCGVTGRKIIVDTYGGMGRHGGGAFSGKDPSKVDRSGAYFGRFVARQVVREGLAERCEVQVAYAIGRARPVSVRVDTFGTGDAVRAGRFVEAGFDFRPGAIVERLGLKAPIYRGTTNYGHFGRAGVSWEG